MRDPRPASHSAWRRLWRHRLRRTAWEGTDSSQSNNGPRCRGSGEKGPFRSSSLLLALGQDAGTTRGADEARVAAELGVADLRLRRRHRERQLLDVPANPLQEPLARL